MNRTAKTVLGVALVAVAAFGARMLLFGPSDRELIHQALDESIVAGKEGRPGGVLDYLSQSLTVNSEQLVDRRQIADFVRKAKPDVTLGPISPEIQGDMATVLTSVQVKFSGFGMSVDKEIPKVTITLRKESAVKWLVFPASQWRIVSVTVPSESLEGLVPSF